MPTYNHMFTIAFTVSGSTSESGEELTVKDYRAGLLRRIISLDSESDSAWTEALGGPDDTYEE